MCKQNLSSKRVKERSIMEVKQKVEQWRYLFKNGEIDKNGKIIKYSLTEAAEKVGVPRKSLEDYRYLLRKAQLLVDINTFSNKRMGFLRSILKQQSRIQQQKSQAFQQSIYEEKYQLKNFEDQIHFESMIVEGETNRQFYDEDNLNYSNCIYLTQSTYQQEGINENYIDTTNSENGCIKIDNHFSKFK